MPLNTQKQPLLPRLPETPEEQERFNEDMLDYLKGLSKDVHTDLDGLSSSGGADGLCPIGGCIPWHKSFPNTPSLEGAFVEANGSTISDSDSVYNGYRSPNENGADVELTVTYTADGGGAYGTVAATDITALKQGDSVTGSGIA